MLPDGKETENTAEPGDIIISGPSLEKYVVKAEKFKKLYEQRIGPEGQKQVIPEQAPRTVAQVSGLVTPIIFKASWGEDMIAKNGDWLVKDGAHYYRIAQVEFEQTYVVPTKSNLDPKQNQIIIC